MLGESAFAFNQASMNNIGTSFNVSRLEYYISEITIVHDGGTETKIKDFWILENASKSEVHTLGDIDLTTIDSIKFSIGVNSEVNHLDPSKYSLGHPLSPKMPSMHWGWSAGYRFVALEGKAGIDLNKTYEIHALGDDYYHNICIPVTGKDDNGDVLIELNADYKESIRNIDVSKNVITHGDFDEAIVLLQNFWVDVFTSKTGVKNTLEVESKSTLETAVNVYPNPAIGEFVYVDLENAEDVETIEVLTLTGQIIESLVADRQTRIKLDVQKPGIYFIRVRGVKGSLLASKKLIIQ
jgi:hypothetical protein